MSLWERLSRLARSEINDAARKVRDVVSGRERDDGAESAAPESGQRPSPSPGGAPRQPTASSWPREVREAYAALELPLGANRAEVKKAYRAMMRRYHPDKHQGSADKERLANEITVRVREAYNLLDRRLASTES